jgi:large exoprotein involved in heme utilization and adhesion
MKFAFSLLLGMSGLLLGGQAGWAQIVQQDATRAVLTGNQFEITGGNLTPDGTNLFHSFSQFGLKSGQTANFNLTNAAAVQNVFSRVTGGAPSVINGGLQASGGLAPNLSTGQKA